MKSKRLKQKKIHISYKEYNNDDDLDKSYQKLLSITKEVLKDAYAPYSEFKVGAAILLENGEIVKGSNQEAAAFPSVLCAERVALFSASAQHPDTAIKAIAISAHSEHFFIDKPITPCGACRQVISEYENKYNQKIILILQGEKGNIYEINGIKNLLPLAFEGDNLKKN